MVIKSGLDCRRRRRRRKTPRFVTHFRIIQLSFSTFSTIQLKPMDSCNVCIPWKHVQVDVTYKIFFYSKRSLLTSHIHQHNVFLAEIFLANTGISKTISTEYIHTNVMHRIKLLDLRFARARLCVYSDIV